MAAFGDALQAEPDNHAARSYRLLALNYLDGMARETLAAEHAGFGEALGVVPAPALPNPPKPGRRIRVAFLSPDLREHSIAFFLEPLLTHLDTTRFEIVLYHDHFVVDATTARLRAR